MKLVNPYGVLLSVRDEVGEELLKNGYTVVGAAQSAPAAAAPADEAKKPTPRTRKSTKNT